MNKETRIVSKKTLKPSETKCNGKLKTRDGYCESKGVAPFMPCKQHQAGRITEQAKQIYKGSLTLDQAKHLEAMVLDSESMEGEIAIQKLELVRDLKDAQHLRELYHELLATTIPAPAEPENSEDFAQVELYQHEKQAVEAAREEIQRRIKDVSDAYEKITKRIQSMLDQTSKAVERNNKVLHGKKYTISIQQLTQVLHLQLNVLERNCMGCPKLKNIAQEFKEMRVSGIGNMQDFENMTGEALPKNIRGQYNKARKIAREESIKKVSDKLDEIDLEEELEDEE